MNLFSNDNSFDVPPKSYWIESIKNSDYPSLREDIEVDVAIVGGGMFGIVTAYLLSKSGFKTAVLEGDRIAHGTSGYTTGKLTSQHGLIYKTITENYGPDAAKCYAASNQWAISFVESTVDELGIDCDFTKKDAYVYTITHDYLENIKEETEYAKRSGIDATFVEETTLPYNILGAVKFYNQAQFHPRKYLLPLAERVVKSGGLIFENTKVVDIDRSKPCKLKTQENNTVFADKVVVACKFPFTDSMGLYFARVYPVHSYIVGVKVEKDLPEGMYINAENPTRSLRTQMSGDEKLLLVAGESHKVGHGGDTKQYYKNLLNFADEHFTLVDAPYMWSTQDLETPDEIPYIGNITRFSEDVYIGTGFKKWGMTTSHVAAKLIRDLIAGEKNVWEDLYSPHRSMNVKSYAQLARRNIEAAKDLITGKLRDLYENINLSPGQGGVFKLNGKTVGAYMDQDGKTYLVEATCPHMGCQLTWNSAEKSWDCPCHGSRFSYKGEIINGPAVREIYLK